MKITDPCNVDIMALLREALKAHDDLPIALTRQQWNRACSCIEFLPAQDSIVTRHGKSIPKAWHGFLCNQCVFLEGAELSSNPNN